MNTVYPGHPDYLCPVCGGAKVDDFVKSREIPEGEFRACPKCGTELFYAFSARQLGARRGWRKRRTKKA